MAIDSRSKRASAAGILLPWLLVPVLPDGTLDQGDRQHIAWSYSGIAAAGPAQTAPGSVTLSDAGVYSLTFTVAIVGSLTITDERIGSLTITET